MRTLVLERPGALALTQRPRPVKSGEAPRPGHALLAVRRVGICGTDLHAYRGRQPFFTYPRVLGHELGTEILALGAGTEEVAQARGLSVGTLCAVEPYLYCGACPPCRQGKTNCCRSLQVLGVHCDGGMCEWIEVPVGLLHPSRVLAADALALVEMLCIGAHAIRRAAPVANEKTLVVGAGPIGLATAQFARLARADVAIVDVNQARLDFAQRALGIEKTLQPRQSAEGDGQADLARLAEDLTELFDGELPSLVLDATGNVESMERAFGLVENGGRLVLVGLVQSEIRFQDPEFHRREMTLLSSRNATAQDFAFVIQQLEQGNIDIEAWITHRSRPETLVEDFPTWLTPEAGVVKAMLEF